MNIYSAYANLGNLTNRFNSLLMKPLLFQKQRRSIHSIIIFFLVCCVVANQVNAQQDSGLDSEAVMFSVSTFDIDGDNPISKSATNSILEPFLDTPLTIETLRQAVTELEKAIALQGYNFYRAELPPQTLNNQTVKIAIRTIAIDEVTVTGNEYFSENNLQRSLPLVKAGSSPNTQQIANALLLAEDNPAKDVRVVFVKGQEPQTVDANISVTDQNPNEFFAWANNSGNRLATNTRLGVQYHNRNLWDRDHQVALSYTLSPENVSELNQYGINYRLPIYTLRGMANAFYSKSDADTGVVADVFEIKGAGETVGLGYTQYLDKRGDYQHRLGINVIDKLFDSEILFEDIDIGDEIRSRPLTIEYTSRFDRNNWLVNSVISYSSNLTSGSFNDDQSYASARLGAQADWSKSEISFRYDHRWNQLWRGNVLMFGQSTSDALIPGEQFGLGGALGDLGPRGFYEREVTVDKGFKTSLQVTRDFPTKGMQLGLFYDYAAGDLINPQAGENPEETLSSIGLSYKWNISAALGLDIDFGYVLDGVNQTLNSTATDDGDSRLHIALRYYPIWPFGGAK